MGTPRWIRSFVNEYNEAVGLYNRMLAFVPKDDPKLRELKAYIDGMSKAAHCLKYRFECSTDTRFELRELDGLYPNWKKSS